MAEVVQPDRRQLPLPQRLARSGHLGGEAAGEPLRMPVGAVELAQHEHGVPDEVEGDQAAGFPVGAATVPASRSTTRL